MRPIPHARRVPTPPDVLPFRGLGGDPLAVPCLHCSSPLALHQPDPESPGRLLGVCESCSRWYLVDVLPGGEVVQGFVGPNPSGGPSLMGRDRDPGPPGEPTGG